MAGTAPVPATPFARSVFVNCPFDVDFLPLAHAMMFAIHDCGFVDISRVELAPSSGLPRFNMPFECGLALGAIRYGAPAGRDFLFMSAEPYQDKVTLSDLAGQDPQSHGNDPRKMVSAVRSFLSGKTGPGERTRGADSMWTRYERFQADLPRLAAKFEIGEDEIRSFDYLRDWLSVVPAWLRSNRPPRSSRS